jgi:hypothetical protein
LHFTDNWLVVIVLDLQLKFLFIHLFIFFLNHRNSWISFTHFDSILLIKQIFQVDFIEIDFFFELALFIPVVLDHLVNRDLEVA